MDDLPRLTSFVLRDRRGDRVDSRGNGRFHDSEESRVLIDSVDEAWSGGGFELEHTDVSEKSEDRNRRREAFGVDFDGVAEGVAGE